MDVGAWLKGLSLERYEHAFRANDIDASLLPEITPEDLIELGVTSIGHRRKLLAAIAELRIPQEAAPSRRPDRPVPQGGAERRQLTIMFIDLVGSTALSTRLEPEEMGDLIRAYQKVCTGVIGHWGGRVAQYMGDGVLAYFGFPQAHEDDAERAVRAGLQMCQEIAHMIADGQPMAARIGIATGLVMVGELIGEGGAQEDAVIGDTPNLAARLQGLAEPGSVVIAPSTRKLLHNLFELRDLGMHSLKGFDAPIQAWQTVSERSFESRFEAYRTIGAAPLVGRDDELEILMRQWRRAIAGDGQTALLVGDAGIGKSRLVAALQEQIAGTPHLRVTYQCSPHHADNTLYPVIRQLEHAAGIRSHHSPAERLERFEALLSSSEDAAKGDASLLASLLSIPSMLNAIPTCIALSIEGRSCPRDQKDRRGLPTLFPMRSRLCVSRLARKKKILMRTMVRTRLRSC